MIFKAALLYITIMLCLSVHAWHSASGSLQQILMKELPALTDASLINSLDEQQELNRISKQLVASLQLVNVDNIMPFKLIESLQVTNLLLLKVAQPNVYDTALVWTLGEQRIAMQITTKPHFNFIYLALLSLVLLLVCIQLELLLNKFYRLIKSNWHSAFYNKNSLNIHVVNDARQCPVFELLSNKTALPIDELKSLSQHKIVKGFSSKQLDWLIVAINNGLSIEDAITVAEQPDSIAFDLENQLVIIHGLHIHLTKTPLFYYYWYVQREMNGLAAYINPPLNKPDIANGLQLSQLMAKYKGHQKAIRDLQEEGLKGKTLDQNRNKIKAELSKVLGELADEYLFINERDVKTARYKYRLNVRDKIITI